jgi:Domain of unknown function (DUF4148)
VKANPKNAVARSVGHASETPMRKLSQYRGGAQIKWTKGAKQMKSSNIRSKRMAVIASVAAAAFIGVTTAYADSASGKTRAQVKADLADAVRSGDIYAGGETLVKLNELFPDRYPVKATTVGKTREQVKAELADAVRSGDIYAGGETLVKLNELFPGLYPQSVVR